MIAFYLGALVLLGSVSPGYFWWSRKTRAEIDDSAGYEWARRAEAAPASVEGLDETRFRAVFQRVHFPRFPKYAFGAVAAFILSLPIAFYLLGAIAWGFDLLGASPDAGRLARVVPVEGAEQLLKRDDGETIAFYWLSDVLLMGYYFGLLFIWLAIVAVAMRRYHARRPGYLDEELANEQRKGKTG